MESLTTKKGLFVCFEFDISKKNETSSGIAKKIYNQYYYFVNKKIDMNFYNPYKNDFRKLWFRLCRRIPLFGHFYKWEELEKYNYDFVYIRKAWFSDYDMIKFLKKIKKGNPNTKIIMEIPTYPYDNEVMKFTDYTLLYKDRIYRSFYKYVDRISTYSTDQMIFNVPTICTHNGILYDEEKIDFEHIKIPNNNEEINIISVSNLGFWHGVDRAVLGLANYYSSNYNKTIKLHIVGDGIEKQNLEKLVDKYHLNEQVIFYGQKNKSELTSLYAKCDIGLDSLGRHRSNVYWNSSLKSKEYLSKGLFIVTSVNSELDYCELPCILKIPADESPLNYNDVLHFIPKYDSIIDRINQKKIISKFAKENYDFSVVLKPIYDYLEDSLCQ